MRRSRDVRFEHGAQEATLLDYLGEVQHATAQLARLAGAIDAAVPAAMNANVIS